MKTNNKRIEAVDSTITIETDEDPFYSEENMERLRAAIADLKAGKGKEHELIEVE